MLLRWFLIGLLIVFAVATARAQTTPQQATLDSTSVTAQLRGQEGQGVTQVQGIRSFWQLTELGGGIRWAIFAVFGIGLFLVVTKWIELVIDKLRSRTFERTAFAALEADEIFDLARRTRPCLAARLTQKLMSLHEVAGPSAAFHEEIANFMRQAENHFSSYRNRMIFLADTAGALGLLGTVWGMFLTFFGGNLDSQRILNGMGIALITTLMGLVVSVVLNFFSTELSGFFSRRLEVATDVGEAIRLELLRRSRRSEMPAKRLPADSVSRVSDGGSGILLRPLSPQRLTAGVGRGLPEPLRVEARRMDGSALAGGQIVFEVQEDGGSFEGDQSRYKTRTDREGRAQANLRLSSRLGPRRVWAYLQDAGNSRVDFEIEGVPGPPAFATAESGNHQSARIHCPLPEPLVVKVADEFGHPVAGAPVSFVVSKGDGRFEAAGQEFETQTDGQGCARARYLLGEQTGVHAVEARVHGLEQSPVLFDAMAQPGGSST